MVLQAQNYTFYTSYSLYRANRNLINTDIERFQTLEPN